MTTVMLPACEPEVIAVGAIETIDEMVVWEKSSRGPTIQGETKPDFVVWGTNLEMASEESDDGFVTKSGTSFAAPMLAGLQVSSGERRRAYGEAGSSVDEAKQYSVYFPQSKRCAVKKDNAYGYGCAMDRYWRMTQVITPRMICPAS
jgi:serine protease AprX